MAHPVDIHVGQMLRQRRTQIGMSQEALAQTSGITFQQVQKYERGVNRLSASRIFEFATVLGVPVMFFFDGLVNAGMGMAEESSGFEHQPREMSDSEMVANLRKITNPEARKHLGSLIAAMAMGNQSY